MLVMRRGTWICLFTASLLVGCSEPSNHLQVSSGDSAHSVNQSGHTTGTDSDERQVEKKQQESQQEPESTGDAQPQEKPVETSRLDQAIQNLESKPIEDPQAPQPVAPAEVHEALQPLVEKSWTRLHPGYEVWFDIKNKQVIVGGRVCFREGPLEMFACPMHTKEHESVVATVSNAEIIHAGLLAVGAINGHPVQWEPEYKAATGAVIQIVVRWKEGDHTKEVPAKEMIIDS
ncbi:MAG: YdjY domain-containing protein, partial [Pirellulaceae bacterium]